MSKSVGWVFILYFDSSDGFLFTLSASLLHAIYLCQMPRTCQPYLYSLSSSVSVVGWYNFKIQFTCVPLNGKRPTYGIEWLLCNEFVFSSLSFFLPIWMHYFHCICEISHSYFFLHFILMSLHSCLFKFSILFQMDIWYSLISFNAICW